MKLAYDRIQKSGNTSVLGWLKDIENWRSQSKQSSIESVCIPANMNLRQIWQFDSFYSFTIVRNPYSRILSAYFDKLASGNAKFDNVPGFGRKSQENFSKFINYLNNVGLYYNRYLRLQFDLLYKNPDKFSFIGE